MSKVSASSCKAKAAIATIPLVLCSLLPSFARADGVSSPVLTVVDEFLSARASRDVDGVAAMFDQNAQILDGRHGRTTGPEDLSQVLPIGETIEIGPRHEVEDGAVIWTETVWESGRPSWENNLNWWMDDNAADAAQFSTPGRGETPKSDIRLMQAVVRGATIARLSVTPADPLEAANSSEFIAVAQTPHMLVLAATVALIGIVLLAGVVASEPTARPAANARWLVPGLNGWIAERQAENRTEGGLIVRSCAFVASDREEVFCGQRFRRMVAPPLTKPLKG